MRYGHEHKGETRARILKEAAAAIRTDGFERVGVAALMARAGLTHGGFYAHWPSKDALFADAIDAMLEEGAAAYFAGADDGPPGELLARWVEGYLSMRHRDATAVGCPVPILAGGHQRLPDAARARLAAAITRMRTRAAGLLARMGAEEPEPRAASAVAEMVGAVALSRALPDAEAADLLAAARASVRAKLGLPAE